MKKPILVAAAAALAITLSPAAQAAQSDAPAKSAKSAAANPAPAAKKPTPEQIANVQRAARILRAFNVVFEAKQTSQPVKSALLRCLYNNKLAVISAAAGKVIAENPNLKDDNINDVFHAAGGVCGLTFKKKEAADGAAKPAGDKKAPAGR
jgi:hypothetical protein